MKAFIGFLITASISMGIYLFFLKQAAPGPGLVATQTISLTGVQTDLVAIAQAERMSWAQNGSYTDPATLASTGTMNINRTSRDGYTYSVDPSGNAFTVTAQYTAPPPETRAGVAPAHFPTITIDQNMEIHRGD